MPKKPETLFKEKITPKLKALGYVVKIQQVSIRGVPDILMCIGGQFVALELKKDHLEKPDPLQAHTLSSIEKNGGVTFVVSPQNWDKVYNYLLTLG